MPDRSWSQRFEELRQDIAAADGDAPVLRGFLFGLYELLRSDDVRVQNAFQGVTEEDLALGQVELAEELSRGGYTPGALSAQLTVQVAEAFHLLRALEAALVSLGELQRSPRRAEELAVSYRGAGGWVTTHTEFDVSAHPEVQDVEGARRNSFAYDFEQAQRKIAPLLSALVSGADYLFDLSPSYEAGSLISRLTPRAALGGLSGSQSYSWDNKLMRLESLSQFSPESNRRPDTARKLGDQLLRLIEAALSVR